MAKKIYTEHKENKAMKILYILPSYNIYGGTPKKTLDLMKFFGSNSSLYIYQNEYQECKEYFINTKGNVYEGFFGNNIFKHVQKLLKIIDNDNINIIQTQFSMGEFLGFMIKIFRPKVKLIIAFVGPFNPNGLKNIIVSHIYKRTDAFIYITQYIKRQKIEKYPFLKYKRGDIIYNGTEKRMSKDQSNINMKDFSILDIAGLIEWKNISILIKALKIIVYDKNRKNIHLYIAGDGPQKKELESLIIENGLDDFVFLLGYQSDVAKLLESCNIFVHPAYFEGFGIAVAEAMRAEKPIIVSNAGALPELIEHEKSGLIVDPHNAKQWADAILKIMDDNEFAKKLAKNAETRANQLFSLEKFTYNYDQLYRSVLT